MLDDIRHMVHTMYADNLSRSAYVKPAAGLRIALQAAWYSNNALQGNDRKDIGHPIQDCAP